MDSSNLYVLAAAGGLIVLHASQVQPKNTSSVLIANLLGIAFATIAYWATGFAFAIGDVAESNTNSNFFLSYNNFFLINTAQSDKVADYNKFVDTLCVLILAIVICNSGFLARMRCWIYPIIIVAVAGFLYPCVYHWIYTKDGWLRTGIDTNIGPANAPQKQSLFYNDEGMVGLIHIFGGTCALIGTIIIGTRKERKDKKFSALGGNLNPLIVVGGVLAMVGLTAKNMSVGASTAPAYTGLFSEYVHKTHTTTQSVAFLNTMLSAHASAIIAFTLKRTKICGDPSGTKALINGALAGIVAVSCAPHMYLPWYAFVIGVVAGLAYTGWTALFHCCRIDDPTDSAAVHLGAGIWAALAGPIFREEAGIIKDGSDYRFELFGWQMLSVLAIFVWAGLTLFIVVIPFILCRVATYKETDIQQGLDVFELDDPAFPDKSQYSQDLDTDQILDDVIASAGGKGSYDNPAVVQHMWDQPDQDWRLAQY